MTIHQGKSNTGLSQIRASILWYTDERGRKFPWLVAVESGGTVTGMMCSIYKREINTTNLLFGAQPHALTFAKIAMLKVLSTLRLLNLRPIVLPQREVVESVRHFRLSCLYKSKLSMERSVLVGAVGNPTHNQIYM